MKTEVASLQKDHDADYFLISFAPSSGIGFYHFGYEIYKFDIISGVVSLCERSSYSAILLEQDQVDARISFPDVDRLKRFSRREYLRDKKHSYVTLILTEELPDRLLREVFHFLSDPDIIEIELSQEIRPVLYELASRSQTQRVLYDAQSFPKVIGTLVRELPQLTFEVLGSALEGSISGEVPSGGWLSAMIQAITLAETIPNRTRRYLSQLIEAFSAASTEVGTETLQALSQLGRALNYDSPQLSLRFALESASPDAMASHYAQAWSKRVVREPRFPERLYDLSRRVMESTQRWTGEWGWPFPWRSVGLETSGIQQECLQAAFEYQGSTLGGRWPNGLAFEVQFAIRPESIRRELLAQKLPGDYPPKNYPIEEYPLGKELLLASRTAFWLAFLLDPLGALERLGPLRSPRLNSLTDVLEMTRACYELWGGQTDFESPRGVGETASLWSVCYPDVVNFAVVPIGPTASVTERSAKGQFGPIRYEPAEFEEFIVAVSDRAVGRDIGPALGLPDPLTQLANNLLSWHLFEGNVPAVQTIRRAIGRSARPIELNGIFRIVL